LLIQKWPAISSHDLQLLFGSLYAFNDGREINSVSRRAPPTALPEPLIQALAGLARERVSAVPLLSTRALSDDHH
jgi:hypothetical protein